MAWLDRLLNQPSPEQLVTLQLRTLIQLQQETNLLLREAVMAMGKSPVTPQTITVIDQAYGNMPTRSTTQKRARGMESISSTDDVNRPKPMTNSVETALGLDDPPSPEPEPLDAWTPGRPE